MTTAFMLYRPFAPDLEVHLSCLRGQYHLKIVRPGSGMPGVLHDEDHQDPASVVNALSQLIYSRSQPNIGALSRLVYGLRAHPELTLREFRGVSIEPERTREPFIQRR